MRTHILFAFLTALVLTSCASYEGRSVASTKDQYRPVDIYKAQPGPTDREFGGGGAQ